MKKLWCILLALTMMICLFSGCNPQLAPAGTNSQLNIVTTIFPQYDFARQLVKDHGQVTMLMPPGTDSHSYEPTPADIMDIQQSDLFIYVGGESDHWIENILESIDTSTTKIIALMDLVDTLQASEHSHAETCTDENHNHGDDAATDTSKNSHSVEYDEHVWTSPKNAITITRAIANAVCALDKENESIYRENEASYIQELSALDQTFTDIVEHSTGHTVAFGDRFPFIYFTQAYHLNYLAAFPGCSDETEPSAATMAEMIRKISMENIPVVFYLENSDQKVADTLCDSTNAEKRLFHSCHTITREELENGATYVSLMSANAKNLKDALA